MQGDYKVELHIEVSNKPGVLAQVAAAIAAAASNIENVEYKERDLTYRDPCCSRSKSGIASIWLT